VAVVALAIRRGRKTGSAANRSTPEAEGVV
jgi:hypothetical protein